MVYGMRALYQMPKNKRNSIKCFHKMVDLNAGRFVYVDRISQLFIYMKTIERCTFQNYFLQFHASMKNLIFHWHIKMFKNTQSHILFSLVVIYLTKCYQQSDFFAPIKIYLYHLCLVRHFSHVNCAKWILHQVYWFFFLSENDFYHMLAIEILGRKFQATEKKTNCIKCWKC